MESLARSVDITHEPWGGERRNGNHIAGLHRYPHRRSGLSAARGEAALVRPTRPAAGPIAASVVGMRLAGRSSGLGAVGRRVPQGRLYISWKIVK